MSWYRSFEVSVDDGVNVNVRCFLDTQGAVNELIDKLVKAKNEAFPSGVQEHKKAMEALNEGSIDSV